MIQKLWGLAYELYRDDDLEVVRIEICPGGYSSRHFHEHKNNTFLVVSGELLVMTDGGHSEQEPTTVRLAAGDSCTVKAGIAHRFRALVEGTIAYEFYTASAGRRCDPHDIIRMDEGGVS